ncbi:ammonium transporter 3 member 1-like [Juglans microcarpa x Juglans regia]|uniref:ammonium transporter 3 member 1-like n=1 Tax=Juglans microcarpa x Juglans regia TaxID=2249226 RepID=UPI001B7F0D5B|nr:ammonium transporter 3 member 1-like [Juglans microcarpa x Juglans regia]
MANASVVPSGYLQGLVPAAPEWLNKGDNAWQMISATLVGMQGMPGLVILYAGLVKKKWALNSAFMALFAFAAVMPCWVLWAYKMSFGHKLLPFWGKAGLAVSQDFLIPQAVLPSTSYKNVTAATLLYPTATMVFFQFAFAAVTVILLAGSVLGRMSIKAWMLFVPLWITFSYSVGAFSVWGGGFLFQWGVLDYSGGYVVHLASGAAGFTAAFWVGPRLREDRDEFPPNNLLLALAGAGILWMGWSGFNGGDPFSANVDSSMAVLNTHICAATSLLVWTCWDVLFFKKPSVIGAIQGMITGLVCITPGAGLVQGWAALVMGIVSGTIPWYTMMVLSRKLPLLQAVDDTLGVLHTHAVAGILGGALTGLFAHPNLLSLFLPVTNSKGSFYGGERGVQFWKQLVGACFIIGWNVLATSIILLAIKLLIPLRMTEEELKIGDDAAHGEEAYALIGQGQREQQYTQDATNGDIQLEEQHAV